MMSSVGVRPARAKLRRVARKVLISAGEASGDLYASSLVEALHRRHPDLEFLGCTGPRMRSAGVRTIVDSASIAVVGLVEVVTHIPRIYGEYRKMIQAAAGERPDLAILTDSPDFHLRLARRFKRLGIPVVYLVAPQVWAWRSNRLQAIRRNIDRLLCIFPFEPEFFAHHGIEAKYIGHPLTRLLQPSARKNELRARYGVANDTKLVALLPGSRRGEIARHLPVLIDAVRRIREARPGMQLQFVLGIPPGLNFRERISEPAIKLSEGQTWDVLACADLALAASGTVTIEAALLGTPMITFYRVNGLSWLMGKLLVRVPFYSMVNLVAGRRIVPELMQSEMTAERLARETLSLLENESALDRMRQELALVAQKLGGPQDPMEVAASIVEQHFKEEMVHA